MARNGNFYIIYENIYKYVIYLYEKQLVANVIDVFF